MKNDLIRRFYKCEIRAEAADNDGTRIITGRPIVYGQPTDIGGLFEEVIERGALEGTDLTDVRLLINHNVEMVPIARSRRNNGNSTMRLMPDLDGLGFNASVDVRNNADSRTLCSAIDRGDLSGMSFMFSVAPDGFIWEREDTDYPLRRITKIQSVVEISACTFPAYEQTEISTRSAKELESARALLESMKKARSNKPLEKGDKNELELLKLKINLLGGF